MSGRTVVEARSTTVRCPWCTGSASDPTPDTRAAADVDSPTVEGLRVVSLVRSMWPAREARRQRRSIRWREAHSASAASAWFVDIRSPGIASFARSSTTSSRFAIGRPNDVPSFPGDPERIHWSCDDPAAVRGTPEECQRAFDRVATPLVSRMRIWLSLPTIGGAIRR